MKAFKSLVISSIPEYGLWTSDVLEKSFWDDDNASYNGEVESWTFTRRQRENKPTPVPKVDRSQNSRQTDQVWSLPLFSAFLRKKSMKCLESKSITNNLTENILNHCIQRLIV